jgi:hypothetical protein
MAANRCGSSPTDERVLRRIETGAALSGVGIGIDRVGVVLPPKCQGNAVALIENQLVYGCGQSGERNFWISSKYPSGSRKKQL